MAGEIASLFVKLGLDARDFTAGVAAANKTTADFGKSAVSAGTVAKAGFLAVGAGLAIATKGAAEAEAAQGKFMAATGASRDEAKAFVTEMDGLAGSAGAVGLSFADIASAGTMVQQQFGTTGQATADLTENVLEFSKVTGEDATQAAGQLDDTLTAFGLSAKDAHGFMDELVASSQKYGTDVGPAQLDVLQKMAPALQAVGGNAEDAVGFLNLYEAAGGDASSATKGLTQAIQKLPEGENIDQFVEHLSNLKAAGLDPTSEAIKVFGSRAGVQLAAAIQPGMHGMEDLAVSADKADGSVSTAAQGLETTADKIHGIADKFVAGAREIGQKFGPAITGAASAASLLAPLAKQFAKIGAPVAKAFAKPFTNALGAALGNLGGAGSKLGAKLALPLTNAVTGAFMKLSGNPKIGGAMDKLGGFMGGRLGGGMATAFKAAGILALIAVAIDEWGKLQAQIDANKKAAAGIDKATGDYLAGMPSPQEVQAKIDALKQVPASLTGVQGALYNLGQLGEGNVIGSAFDALFGANPAQVADDKIKQMEDYLKTTGADKLQSGVDAVTSIPGAAAPALADGFDQFVQAWEDGSKAVIKDGQTLAEFDPDLGQWLDGRDFADAAPDVQDAVQTWIDAQNTAIAKGAKDDAKALADMKTKITDGLSAIQDAFDIGVDTKAKKNISGADRLKQMAADIDQITKNMNASIKANDPVNTAYWESALIDATNKYNTAKGEINVDSAQISADVAAATSSAGADLTQLGQDAKGATNTINNAADNVNYNPAANNVGGAADDMHDSFKQAGNAAGQVAPAINSYDDQVSRAANHLAYLVSNPLDQNLHAFGAHMIGTWVQGIRDSYGLAQTAVNKIAHIPPKFLQFSEPPQYGPLHSIKEWGPHMIDQWIGPMLKHGMVKVPAAAKRLSEYLASMGDNAIGEPAIAAPGRPVHHDHHRRHHNYVGNPDVAPGDSSGAGITVNVTVQGNIYGAGGTKQLAADLEKYIRRSKRGGARLVGAF